MSSAAPPHSGVRSELQHFLRAAIDAVEPAAAVARQLSRADAGIEIAGRRVDAAAAVEVIALGKAAAPMARAASGVLGERLRGGLVVTAEGCGLDTSPLPLVFGSHPVPDARSEQAARQVLARVAALGRDDVLCVLLSGGTSALTSAPLDGLSQPDLAETTQLLLRCGAEIGEVNTVRKHVCRLAGGRLACAAQSERIEVIAISDVPGDAIDVIGSGPCAADPTTFADALEVFAGRGVAEQLPTAVREHLVRGVRGDLPETPKPGDPRLRGVRHHVVACNGDARAAVVSAAGERGLRAIDLGEVLRGEASEAGRRLAAVGCSAAASTNDALLLVAGGETTVDVRGDGVGGRSQELALAAAIALEDEARVSILAAGSDGRDGPTDAAGAFADGGSVARGRAGGSDARLALERNDSHAFFAAEGGLLRTGPTRTNVMDLVFVHVAAGRP